MISRLQFTTFLSVAVFVILGIAATNLPNKPRNLKVLPQDISDKMLDSIMHSYNKALGVGCDFCHAPFKKSNDLSYNPNKKTTDGLNYESDENTTKDEARKMMRLTIGLNRDYFYYDSTKRPEYLSVVTCITCHRGDPMPADLK
jgi:hypothetical protein